VSSRPDRDRVAKVAGPTIPDAATPCAFDPAQLCNTDEETGTVIGGYDDALNQANRKLNWICRWFGYKDCPAD
jgi:hypothetical protein